jgi:hypothetical protein
MEDIRIAYRNLIGKTNESIPLMELKKQGTYWIHMAKFRVQ